MEGYYSAHGSHPGDLLEIASADAMQNVTVISDQ